MSTNPSNSRSFQRKVKPFEKQDLWYTKFPIDVIWGIYARQSTIAQVKNNIESYEMQTDDLLLWLVQKGVEEGHIFLFDADLGRSGKLRIDERTGMQELVERIKSGEIKAVLVYRVSRLFRDDTGIQYNTFAQVCKEHHCLLVTAADGMIFNFDIPMHLNMFRYLAAQAAEENTQRGEMMSQLKIRKARKGLYAGLGIIPTGFIVDYDKRSKTFEKIIPYPPHAKVVLGFFKRYFELEGNLQKLCRELEEKAVIFPEFEDWVDERIVHMWKRRKVPGGYKITDKGLRLLLTNPIYIGWWIVMGEVIFRDNHERIIPEEYEYFFWFAFDRLSPVTTEGERNEERIYLNPTRRRFYQKHTKERSALLKDRAAFPDGEVSVHSYDNKSHYCLIPPYTMRQTGWKEIQSSIVDDAFTDRFFERLGQTTEFRDFQAWIAQETRKQTSDVAMIDMQLVQLEAKQEAIIDDRLSLRQQITLIRDDEQREKAQKQAQPTFDLYLRQADKLERTKEDLVKKRERAVKNQALDTARKYATFQIELKELHDTWDDKPFDRKLEFVNLFVTKAVLTLPASHFVQLDIHWSHPLWGRDSLIIFRKIGASPYWTTPEKELIRRLYPRAQREELLSQLPFKTWASIKTEAKALGVKREIATASEVPDSLSWSDWVFMQEHEITTQMLYSKLDTQC